MSFLHMLAFKRLLDKEVQLFIRQNEEADVAALALSDDLIGGLPPHLIISQIVGRKKAKLKIPEWYNTENIIFPKVLSMEQCSSEITAKYKATLVSGESFADLTGGAGVDTFYMSQSFEEATYLDADSRLASMAEHNFATLGAENITCKHGDAFNFLDGSLAFSWLYVDPARRDDNDHKVAFLEDCRPNILTLLPEMLKASAHVLLKTAPMLDISLALEKLPNTHKVHVVAVNNECKEVLYEIGRVPAQQVEVVTVNFPKNGPRQVFSFNYHGEKSEQALYAKPGKYLYEPNASIMKAGAFKAVSSTYQIAKLHPNSHLYTSDKLLNDFPGRIFKVEQCLKLDKKVLNQVLPEGKANIATRNFPMSVKDIRKKTGLKDGGENYLFATTLQDNTKVVLVTKKVKPEKA